MAKVASNLKWAATNRYSAFKEMQRNRINIIIGIGKIRWPGVETCPHEHGIMYYSGSNEKIDITEMAY